MRLLVTGGAGFIGANFVHGTVRERPEVSVTVLDAMTYAGSRESLAAVDDDIRVVEGDVTDAELVAQLVADSDAVVHFAAETHVDNALADPEPFVRTNVVGTFTVLEAVRRHGVRLHHVSTDEVYGDLALDDPHAVHRADARTTRRVRTRRPRRRPTCWCGRGCGPTAWRATISNCSNNYGPYQHVEKFIPRQITNVLTGRRPKLYGSGANVRDWIHVDDHNSAVWRIIEDGQHRPDLSHRRRRRARQPDGAAHDPAVMGRDPDDFDHVPDRAGHDLRYAIDPWPLHDELGWKPAHSDFAEGLRATIDWYRAQRIMVASTQGRRRSAIRRTRSVT